jgi:SAM-dependent methyltransferase
MAQTSDFAGYSPEPYLQLPAGYYDRVFRRGRGVQWFWHLERFRRVERAIPPGVESVLDLGCGPGTFLGRAERRFGAALGIDLAPAQIEYARRHYARPGLDFQVADVTALESSRRFDAVVAIEVIEHLPAEGIAEVLERVRGLVKPGGWAVLTTPNYRSLWPLLEWAVSRVGPADYRAQHINHFTEDRARKELAAAGFEDIWSETFFVAAPFLAALSSRLARSGLRLESRLLPRLGSEILVRGRRPAE